MGKEMERKFLVKNNDYKKLGSSHTLKQGYMYMGQDKVIKVRIFDNKGFITIKGKKIGLTRLEYEYEIPLDEAYELLLNFCEGLIIEKRRYIVDYLGFKWEIDEFMGDNEGLVVAEIEIAHEKEEFPKPEWINEEVTGDPRYLNSNLIQKPYKFW